MKKSYFFKFFVFALVGALAILPSCKDYDDDISGLETSVSTVKSDLTALQSSVTTAQSAATAAQSSATDALAKANEALAAAQAAGDAEAITALETQVDGLVAQIADINAELDTLAGLEARVEALMAELEAANEAQLEAIVADVEAIIAEVEGMSVALTKLELIPDFVADYGGSLPIINFSPLVAECGEIAPSALVRYQVSPSNVTKDKIDVDNIYFKYNNPTVLDLYARSAKIDPKAEFVSLEDGILTVRVDISTEELEYNSNKIDQLMLMVPLTAGGEISSNWAKVVSSETYSEELALVRIPKIDAETAWSAMELTTDLDATKALVKTDLRVVDITYDETLDLLDVVNTMITEGAWSNFNIDTYNLEYVFDLKYYNATTDKYETIKYEVGTNNTDQQKFINLVGSEVSTRVYDLDGPNPASIDRTPIVRVTLVSKNGAIDCPVLEGFIKLNIVEKKVVPVPPVTFPVEGKVEAGCDDFELVVGTQEMNEEFYAVAGVSKAFFHDNYDWYTGEFEDGIGEITEVVDPEDTQSYNLVWTVTADELWDNVGETITQKGYYKYGSNVIAVEFTATVTQPTYAGPKRVDNQWFDNYSYMKFNVAVPASGATDPAEATFDTNINDGFLTTSDKLLDLPAQYSYEYVFDPVQPITTIDGIAISVSADGKELIAKRGTVTETVATILPQAVGTGDILSYNEESELGKELLNKGAEFMKARLNLKVYLNCEGSETVKEVVLKNGAGKFNVHFLRPVNVEGKSTEHFVDGVDCGATGSVLDLTDVVQLSDWRNYAKNTTDYYFDPNHENYYDYYDVQSISVNLDDITLKGLKVDGVEHTEILSTMNIEVLLPVEGESVYGSLQYCNSGSNLAEQFSLMVPVTVTYKWGEVSTVVEVPVKPTSTLKSAR